MKHLILLFGISLYTGVAISQIKAVTTNGDEVLLNNDGSWKYVNAETKTKETIDTSKQTYEKKASSSFLVKSKKVNYGVYIDPKKWSFAKSNGDEASEIEFTLKNEDAYGMMITEKIEIPIGTLKQAALSNARDVAPDIAVAREEYRKVNGRTVLFLQMSGTLNGIKFTYSGYYFSSAGGTVQLITYTASNLLEGYQKEIEDFLNGFVVMD